MSILTSPHTSLNHTDLFVRSCPLAASFRTFNMCSSQLWQLCPTAHMRWCIVFSIFVSKLRQLPLISLLPSPWILREKVRSVNGGLLYFGTSVCLTFTAVLSPKAHHRNSRLFMASVTTAKILNNSFYQSSLTTASSTSCQDALEYNSRARLRIC